MTNPALETLSNRSADAGNAARERRATAETPTAKALAAYREGEAIAYSDAHRIMTAELRRLCNRFQNGCLSVADFGIVL
jgi:hypothetical protein